MQPTVGFVSALGAISPVTCNSVDVKSVAAKCLDLGNYNALRNNLHRRSRKSRAVSTPRSDFFTDADTLYRKFESRCSPDLSRTAYSITRCAVSPAEAKPANPFTKEKSRIASLILEDGTELRGVSFGAETSVAGEAVFQTGMVGYPETLTDASYRGQILVFTYPEIGNYGVPADDTDDYGISKYFESEKIQVAGVIVRNYVDEYSHWQATKSLSKWLKENNIPALSGIDTRYLTKKIRDRGSLLAKIVFNDEEIAFDNPNERNLVAEVSIKEPKTYTPAHPVLKKDGSPLKIVAVDCGIKNNMIRNFVDKGVELTVVPWDFDFNTIEWDGLFVSNGPGDPMLVTATVDNLKKATEGTKPIFGICMGNQLLSQAAGGSVFKMLFGNRGQNQPCIDIFTEKTFITVQNHGFAVDPESLPDQWEPYFKNASDGTSEGIRHKTKPFFSVQFHPESFAGPLDTLHFFDLFLSLVKGDLKWPPESNSLP